jgi:type IV fimbrial biogenesis protein FimT
VRPARSNRGFTLIELLVVIVIMAILSALAAPSMGKLIATQRMRGVAADLHLALVKARAEAIKRNVPVEVSPTGGSWTAGWSILDPAGGAPLDVHGPAASVTVATTATHVIYQGTGRVTGATNNACFVITSTRTDAARSLKVDQTGRPYLKEAAACD